MHWGIGCRDFIVTIPNLGSPQSGGKKFATKRLKSVIFPGLSIKIHSFILDSEFGL
jgi:hypothetical protein